jgi:hypothetical protein
MTGPCQRCDAIDELELVAGAWLCAVCRNGDAAPAPATPPTPTEPPPPPAAVLRKKTPRIISRRASSIRPEITTWLWQGWLPLRMLSLLAGLPGLGKSTLALGLAAQVTRGTLEGALAGTPADVLIASYEDAIAETIMPRLMAANADLDRVHTVEAELIGDSVDLTTCIPQIDRLAAQHQARLLFVDPLVAGMPAGEISSHRDQDVRSVLAPLATMAERRGLCALASMHFSKAAVDALLGVGGSIGFVGAARSVLIFGADPNDDRGEEGPARVLAHRKCNVGRRQASRACWIEPRLINLDEDRVTETSLAILGDEIDVDADELVRPREKRVSALVDAERFLRHLLTDGPHRAAECIDLAADRNMSERTLRRAKKEIGADAFRRDDVWWWVLTDEDDDDDEEAPPGPPGDDDQEGLF